MLRIHHRDTPPDRYVARVLLGDWIIHDTQTGDVVTCPDRGTAIDRAATLNAVWRIWGNGQPPSEPAP